ncbi:hypothetical protein L5515_012495 [Caenorhabditis briggsae]|uniref:Uncharacterized protein n=1 Tax=Caenorhabditis briggsae TaxID=6238 RepID=A0AAE9JH61_CAEBR|nr:hypothetical protein L5515_012495 [Caenorhabditis briggsae]
MEGCQLWSSKDSPAVLINHWILCVGIKKAIAKEAKSLDSLHDTKDDVVLFMTMYIKECFEKRGSKLRRSIFSNYTKLPETQNKPQINFREFDRNARNADSITLRTNMLNWFLERVNEEFRRPELNMDSLTFLYLAFYQRK